jgi:hypothetical protein
MPQPARQLAAFLLLCLLFLPQANAETFTGRVVTILDGDTVDVLVGKRPRRVRLEGIDAPEKAQAFGYAAKVDGCRWVLVSNFLELRLYRTDRGQGYCQRFALADLADPERLRTFLFLLSRESLFGSAPEIESPVERLAASTHIEEQRISKAFYVFYRDLRIDLFHQLRADNPAPAGTSTDVHLDHLLERAQKLLDRCLFICFCEDTRLLPPKILMQERRDVSALRGTDALDDWLLFCLFFCNL